jgi:hypothetical protein
MSLLSRPQSQVPKKDKVDVLGSLPRPRTSKSTAPAFPPLVTERKADDGSLSSRSQKRARVDEDDPKTSD